MHQLIDLSPPGHKETVRALVQNHAKPVMPDVGATSNLGATMDLIRGKGKGLIILLHGEPGMINTEIRQSTRLTMKGWGKPQQRNVSQILLKGRSFQSHVEILEKLPLK